MGEESATCIEAAELEIEAVKGMMEEKMQTNQFSDISCRIFLSKLYDLFRRPCEDTTSLSSMHFTHTTPPGDAASVASTLQIFSVKLEEINEEALESNCPLRVYGTVAARDTVDHNRNILFHRARDNCQILTKKDPCLELTGPSRAIVAIDPVDFEIELKVKGSRKKASEDRVLMRQTFVYSGDETTLLNNNHCRIMLRCAKLENTVQATVVSVRVINWRKRAWPFKHGGKVSCIAKGPVVKPEDEEEVVLQHHLAASNNSHDGYLHLSRRVVSVELNGQLRVTIHSSKFRGHVFFLPQECKSSTRKCHLGPYEVEVTVAWSLLIQDRRCFIPREECVDGGQAFKHTAKEIRRGKTTLETQSAMEIYSLLDLISKNATKLKTEPKLRISDYSISEIKIHMDYMYRDVTSLLQMMEKVDNSRCQEPFMEKMDGKTRMEDKGKSATEMQSPKTYYKYLSAHCFLLHLVPFLHSLTRKASLSSMQFTYSTPGQSPSAALVDSTLQIYSIKVAEIERNSGLSWPLRVYGVVAARDTVDRNRNILFSRQRDNCQILTPKDPFLRLTGPSRAIVTREPAHVEIELKVKGAKESEDSVLMSHVWYYSSSYHGLRTLYIPLEGDYCTMVLSAEPLGASVQATIVGIHVHVPEGRPSPFEYGGRVVCCSLPWRKGKLPDSQHIAADPSFRQVVLQDGEMPICPKGYLNLSRHAVSVKLRGKLEVVIEARLKCGAVADQVVVSMDAQGCNITRDVCHLGDSKLEITVAWSHLVESKALISML